MGTIFSNTLETVAPIKLKKVREKLAAPWYNSYTHSLKKETRNLERKWRKTNLEVFIIAWTHIMSSYRQALKTARTEYISKLIDNHQNNPRFLFSTVRWTNKQINKIIDQQIIQWWLFFLHTFDWIVCLCLYFLLHKSLIILKLQVCLIRVGAKIHSTAALQDQRCLPLFYCIICILFYHCKSFKKLSLPDYIQSVLFVIKQDRLWWRIKH